MSFFTSYFLHPGFLAAGVFIVAAPVIIHLINRLRFRRVRFAAMEFLLASEQRNRSRLLMEQLILLALRTLAMLLLVALVARLILSQEQWALFRGSKVHHVVLLDDTASMRDRDGETSAWQRGLALVRELASVGANRPGTQRLTVLRATNPDQPLLAERDIDEQLVIDLAGRLQESTPCSHQAADVTPAFETVRRLFAADPAGVKQFHWISDFRERDWRERQDWSTGLKAIHQTGGAIHLIRVVKNRSRNIAVANVTGDLAVAVAGIPLRLNVTLKNCGATDESKVRATLWSDGLLTPVDLFWERLPAGEEATQTIDLRLETPGPHRLEVRTAPDPLDADNRRYLICPVANTLPILVIDGDASGEAGQYVADAISADPKSTGISAIVESVEFLRRQPLTPYRAILLVNVPEIPVDAQEPLARFVREGGGIAWFLGDLVQPAAYRSLTPEWFPYRLDAAPQTLLEDVTQARPDIVPGTDPLFSVLSGDDNPFLDAVKVSKHWLPAGEVSTQATGLTVLATLRDGSPLVAEHRVGRGRVITCLTTAGPNWNNWALNPSYVVFQLELVKRLASRELAATDAALVTGAPLVVRPDFGTLLDEAEIEMPTTGSSRLVRMRPSPGTGDESSEIRFRDTDEPGFYRVRPLSTGGAQAEDRWLACNVPAAESDLSLVSTRQLQRQLAGVPIEIHEAGEQQWQQWDDAGADLRLPLVFLLIALLLIEQFLAWRFSYHLPAIKSAA